VAAEFHLEPPRELDLFGLVQELCERAMRLEAVPLAGLDEFDITFAVDAELHVEAAGLVAADPRAAPAIAPQNIHRDVEDVGVTRERTPGLVNPSRKSLPWPSDEAVNAAGSGTEQR
jgi:hypothetical protein